MTRMLEPITGQWYRHIARDQVVRVLEVRDDGDHGFIEAQYGDGRVQKIAMGPWLAMDLEPVDEPPGWPGPERVQPSDLKQTVQSFPPATDALPSERYGHEDPDWANRSVEREDERPGRSPS